MRRWKRRFSCEGSVSRRDGGQPGVKGPGSAGDVKAASDQMGPGQARLGGGSEQGVKATLREGNSASKGTRHGGMGL